MLKQWRGALLVVITGMLVYQEAHAQSKGFVLPPATIRVGSDPDCDFSSLAVSNSIWWKPAMELVVGDETSGTASACMNASDDSSFLPIPATRRLNRVASSDSRKAGSANSSTP